MRKIITHVVAGFLVLVPLSAAALTVDVDAARGAKGGSMDSSVGSDVVVGTKADVKTDAMVKIDMDSDDDGAMEATITGDPDFDLYVKSVTSAEAQVSEVDVDEDGAVEVAYEHEGKLFGFIPVMVTSRTSVTAESNGQARVHARLPWWSFLVSGISGVQSGVETSLNAKEVIKTGSAKASASIRIKLAEAIVSSLKETDTAVKASYNVKANVK